MKLIDVSKKYDKSTDTYAVKHVSIDFGETGLTFILGKSGSGKTTILNMMGGLDNPTEGKITVGDFDYSDFHEKEMTDFRNANIGFVFQDYNLINELTVSENVELALKISGIKCDDPKMRSFFKMVDLDYDEMKNKSVLDCSGGERQRIAILRALVKKPSILLCDEPTGALDSKTSESVMNLLKNLSKDLLVIIVSHNEKLAIDFADRVIRIKDGLVVDDKIISNHEQNSKSEIKLKKSKPEFKLLSKIGFYNIKNHPLRFAFIILLLVISFSLVGFSLNVFLIKEKRCLL